MRDVHALVSAEADAVCGAGYGERSPEWVNSRNGYRPGKLHRPLPGRCAAGHETCLSETGRWLCHDTPTSE